MQTNRRSEFSRKTKAAAFARSGGRCEGCGLKLQVGRFVYDHVVPDWMGGEATLSNCQVIGKCCDAPKTAKDQGDIAKIKRVRDKHIGAKTPRAQWPCGRRSKWKKKLNGTVVRR